MKRLLGGSGCGFAWVIPRPGVAGERSIPTLILLRKRHPYSRNLIRNTGKFCETMKK
jgi:hypothetical protein